MILITGSNGFVGQNLYNYFAQSQEVMGTTKAELDISKEEDFEKLPNEIDAVVHTAAFVPSGTTNINSEMCFKVNAEGTKNVLEYCRKSDIKKIVYSSSASVYQRLPDTTENMVKPINIYGESKLKGEDYCKEYNEKYGINYVILRYSTVYGFGQKPYSVLPIFANNALNNENLTIFGKGVRTQDFVYIKDVIQANKFALKTLKNEIYNIGSGVETNMLELAQTVKKIINPSININFKEIEDEDISRFYLNINLAKKELNYSPKFNLEQGLKDFKVELNETRNNC